MEKTYVTKTFLPPLEEYQVYLQQIWSSQHLTNQGPLLLDFEAKMKQYLGLSDFHFISNGTVALQLALRALDITGGEIITTPFSYVATTSAILWERCEPVFVDIDADSFCIDPGKIEAAITPKTKAIMAVHVFGRPCDVETIEAIAKKHNIKVIYDGAHAFGVEYKGKSLLSYGDISICSFHSTKLFHTIEGGCIIAKDEDVSKKIELLKRFGHNNDDHYMLGINAKASEFQAAMGLCNLQYVSDNIAKRKKLFTLYDHLLGPKLRTPPITADVTYNYSYYPIVLKNEAQLLKTMEALNVQNIFPRRYFYPSLNSLPYIKTSQPCPVSERIASKIMCVPMHGDLDPKIVERICDIIKRCNDV